MVEDRSNPSPKYSARLRFNIGPNASIDTLYRALSDVHQLLSCASQIQEKVDHNEETIRVLRGSDYDEIIFPYPSFRYMNRFEFLSPAIERLIAQRLVELAPQRIVRVSRILYENPCGINFNFSGEAIAKILSMISNWKSDRRIAEAKAEDYVDLVEQRRRIRGKITKDILDGTLTLTGKQLAEVLRDDTIDSFSRLEIAGLDVELDDN